VEQGGLEMKTDYGRKILKRKAPEMPNETFLGVAQTLAAGDAIGVLRIEGMMNLNDQVLEGDWGDVQCIAERQVDENEDAVEGGGAEYLGHLTWMPRQAAAASSNS
jgi:hypothetical protein